MAILRRRKSPVIDGKVQRDAAGLGVRYLMILSPVEKESRTIALAFKQTVCGFDFHRIPGGKSYVCDVNVLWGVCGERKRETR
jgi:inositol-hexakisphosphate/diphosphoinositol-pentakisphosphate 1-kinase